MSAIEPMTETGNEIAHDEATIRENSENGVHHATRCEKAQTDYPSRFHWLARPLLYGSHHVALVDVLGLSLEETYLYAVRRLVLVSCQP